MKKLQKNSSPLLQILSEIKGPVAVMFLLGLLINALQLTGALHMMQVYDRVLASRSISTLVAMTLISVFLVALFGVLEACRGYALTGIGGIIEHRLAGPVFNQTFFRSSLTGNDQAAAQPLRDLEQIRTFISANGLTTLLDIPSVPVFFAILYFLHPMFAALGAVAILLVIGTAIGQAALSSQKLAQSSSENIRSFALLESSLQNAEAATAMGMRANIWARWQQRHVAMLNQQEDASRIAGGGAALIKFLQLIFAAVLTMGLGAFLVLEQSITPGVMIVATFVLARALAPSFQAVTLWQSAANARSAHQRLCAFMSSGMFEKKGMELPAPKGALSVENLVLSIPGSRVALLRGVTFSLQAGESLAIVGGSGAGKSTLARGILGIWPPSGGAVRLDGADLSRMPWEQIGRYIGYLPQDVELFEGSVAENIARLGDVDAEKVVAAATAAGLHELVLRLPQGYDTQLGAGGRGLSPGQRQRIGLARALYDEPRFIVLDEPNSNLDSAGEAALSTALKGLRASGVTTVTITHRPNILTIVDKILLLRDGQVEAFGQREEILPRLTRPAKIARPVKAIANS